ncbi:MAG: sodium-dependent transporter [Sulfolobales archaeon]|nr:sodium-dependent transporter [Sulfolobales archaeon]
MKSSTHRELWGSRVGMILALIGVAVGLGNVWRFPYMLGKFGGAAFLLIYILLVLAVGVPALWAELSLARYVRYGPYRAYVKLGLRGGGLIGTFLVIVAVAAVSYYLVVIGWVLWYLIASIGGLYLGVSAASFFGDMLSNFYIQLVMDALVIGFCVLICLGGVRRGIERASRVMMPFVYVTLLIILARAVTLPNAIEGLYFYLKPDWSMLTPITLLAAAGQVFFSLGLGATWIFIYGSYISDERSVVEAGGWTAFGDTLASFIAGLAILPTVYAFGINPASGPPLLFITLPEIFKVMPMGLALASLLFLGLLFAATLSAVPAFEIFADAMAEFGLSRRKAIALMAFIELLLGIPSMLSVDVILYNDLIWSSALQIGSLLAITAFTYALGKNKALEELSKSSTLSKNIKSTHLGDIIYYWIKYFIPTIILIILIYGWYSWFTS